ncbi:MAG: EAL domain-containing protein [Lachnospiraceae bacterium]|nr:EAL domain-containing protein [Lachnospiraceae bacterium]
MKNKKQKRFNKIKKHSVFGSLLLLCVVTLLINLTMLFFGSSLTYYLIESRLVSEYDKIAYMARLYETEPDKDNALKFLDTEGRNYLITDKNGKTIHQNGENTMSETSGNVEIQTLDKKILSASEEDMKAPDLHAQVTVSRDPDGDLDEVGLINSDFYEGQTDYIISTEVLMYSDKRATFLYPDGGRISYDLKDFWKWLKQDVNPSSKEFYEGHALIEAPMWIALPLENGEATLYGQIRFGIDMNDLTFFIMILFGLVLMALTIFILLVVNFVNALRSQRNLKKVFFMDEATSGHNWMYFLYRGGQILKRHSSNKYNFAVLDLVFVNYRNYCMCHSIAEGEKLLNLVDAVASRSCNKKRELCAHYASANFAMLITYQDREELTARIRTLIGQLEQIDPHHNFSYHVGIDQMPASTDKRGRLRSRKHVDLEEEYNNACSARSSLADNDASDMAFFDEKLVEEQKWLDIVQENQRAAIDNEEFLVYYQPKYNPRTKRLMGAEALIRWESPKYGFITPGRFIPIFEKNGFITEIDHYMLKHAAADQKRWLDEGLNCVPISVNVSRAHFIESDLAEQIRDIIDGEGTPRNLIEIELTESAFFDDKKAMIDTIAKLKSYGFHVSMDDFGSGYSSLNTLKDMPLDVLKLDADFFRGENDDGRDKIVVSEAIKLAKMLKMKTVAEGVEAQEQVEFLADQGCDMIQGFIFDKPMPASNFTDKMRHNVADTDENAADTDDTDKNADNSTDDIDENSAADPDTANKNDTVDTANKND